MAAAPAEMASQQIGQLSPSCGAGKTSSSTCTAADPAAATCELSPSAHLPSSQRSPWSPLPALPPEAPPLGWSSGEEDRHQKAPAEAAVPEKAGVAVAENQEGHHGTSSSSSDCCRRISLLAHSLCEASSSALSKRALPGSISSSSCTSTSSDSSAGSSPGASIGANILSSSSDVRVLAKCAAASEGSAGVAGVTWERFSDRPDFALGRGRREPTATTAPTSHGSLAAASRGAFSALLLPFSAAASGMPEPTGGA
mmetsp:Transcript_5709/g.11388  ORF Transcript_5709/g.11388 Transcript_5709/m.11388 type:complete len:255 (-) Transcript_5709:1-765(-)